MVEKLVRDVTWAGVLIVVPAIAAWLTGLHLIFPSLGPSAFFLATGDKKLFSARSVIGGHFIGVVGGLIAYWSLAAGLAVGHFPPALSLDNFRLVMSGVLSLVITITVMLGTKTVHPPACATTLIVSLGLLPMPFDGLLIMVAVVVMFIVFRLMVHVEEKTNKEKRVAGSETRT